MICRKQLDPVLFLGSDKKQLLKDLPSKLPGVIQSETVNTVKKLWEDFDALYSILTSKAPSEDMASYFEKAKGWVTSFTSLRDKRIGYKKGKFDPIHACHGIPYSKLL